MLRRGTGLSLTKLEGCSALRDALGGETLNEAHTLLLDQVRALGGGRDAAALRSALSIAQREPSRFLKQRRERFGDANEYRDPETVETWENAAIRELATRIAAGHSTGVTEQVHVTVQAEVRDGRVRLVGVHELQMINGEEFGKAHYYEGGNYMGGATILYQCSGEPQQVQISACCHGILPDYATVYAHRTLHDFALINPESVYVKRVRTAGNTEQTDHLLIRHRIPDLHDGWLYAMVLTQEEPRFPDDLAKVIEYEDYRAHLADEPQPNADLKNHH